MTVLTANQIALIRAKSGDLCDPYLVADDLMQLYFDAADGNLDCTIVSVLEDRWAKVSPGTTKLNDFGTVVDTTEIDQIKGLMDYYRAKCGSMGAPLGVGVIHLNLDTTWDDVDAAENAL